MLLLWEGEEHLPKASGLLTGVFDGNRLEAPRWNLKVDMPESLNLGGG